ncbi:MAG: pyridoxal phosphate-dependent aminotransferase [Desulfovibrionaceae bacterium]|nr:pyridoxal phosphate-dependent aminotransferase [Desulfovibrionaceae bacterium]MBF0514621.1 pyridoxal phosphate-dependent aminotransferase [Desulfovibrionaceae bacterium]
MNALSPQIAEYIARGSWIRKIFESGIEMKKIYGDDQVCDFSLGNPDLPPPNVVGECLAGLAETAQEPFAFGYMPNAGYPHVRTALAAHLSVEQEVAASAGDVMLTCGAAGGINVFLKAVIEPGEEVLCPAPYFVEYGFYAENHQAKLVPVKTTPMTFELDLAAIDAAITPKTRVVLINSPNNPTGQIYPRSQLEGLCDILAAHNRKRDRFIYLLADEPYRFLVYHGHKTPAVLPMYPWSCVISSFSKNLSLPGARIGYVLLAPDMPEKDELMNGLVFANRILGFVNAPAIAQNILLRALGHQVDTAIYAKRRAIMAEVLTQAGYEFSMPKGAFYFFPKAPGGDDVAFVARLRDQRILAVPGSGFGYPGYFRLAFCVGEEVIERSLSGFKSAVNVKRVD